LQEEAAAPSAAAPDAFKKSLRLFIFRTSLQAAQAFLYHTSRERRNIVAGVDRARRPVHLDPGDAPRVVQAEVQDGLIASEETVGKAQLAALDSQTNDGPDSVSVARRPY
jgi:hypothetical protein